MEAQQTESLAGAVDLNDMTDNYRQCAVEVIKKPAYRNWRSGRNTDSETTSPQKGHSGSCISQFTVHASA